MPAISKRKINDEASLRLERESRGVPKTIPTASLTALQSLVPVTHRLPELRGYAATSLASATTRSAGRPSPICRIPPASLARMIRSSLPTRSLPGPRDGRWSWGGLPTSPLWGGNNGLTNAHCSSVRCASSGAIVTASGGPSVPALVLAARLAARLALRQRAATAWCALLHTDHSSRKRLRLFGAAMARISFLASGTVGGIRSGSRSPF